MESDKPTATIVIPALNATATIARQLTALASQVDPDRHTVLVVDNGSTDDTREVVSALATRWGWLRIVGATDAAGPSYARNVGAAGSASDSLFFCDADDVVGPAWISSLEQAVIEHEICTGSLDHFVLNTEQVATSRGRTGMTGAPTYYGLFPTLSAGNFAIRRVTWDRLGGFDPSYSACEDVELALRAHIAGIGIHYVPSAVVGYMFRNSATDLFAQGLRYGQGRVQVAAQMTALKQPGPRWTAGVRSWAWLVVHLGDPLFPSRRSRFAWVAGNRFGHLLGSFRYRRPLL